MNRFARIIATGLYTGYSPVAPGTAGSLAALCVLWLIRGRQPISEILLGAGIAVIFFLGVWSSARVERDEIQNGRRKDPSIVNIDEMMGMGVSVFLLPPSASKLWLIAGFFLFRLFDIVKPFPADRAQNLKGGWGIMADDLIAGLYANLVLQILIRIF
jgi:phosphatidylglycerophosphatase A